MTASMSPKTCPVGELAESFDPFTEPYLDDPYEFWRIEIGRASCRERV